MIFPFLFSLWLLHIFLTFLNRPLPPSYSQILLGKKCKFPLYEKQRVLAIPFYFPSDIEQFPTFQWPCFLLSFIVSFPLLVLYRVLYSFPMHMLKLFLFFTQQCLTQYCLLFNFPNCFLLQQLLNTKYLLVDLFFPCHFLSLSHSDWASISSFLKSHFL